VHQAAGVGVLQGAGHLGADAAGVLGRQRALPLDAGLQVLALHQLHHQERALRVLAAVEHPHDARVGQAGHRLRLAPEALGDLVVVQQRGAQALEGDIPLQHGVVRLPDGGHAAAPDLAIGDVPAGSRRAAHGAASPPR